MAARPAPTAHDLSSGRLGGALGTVDDEVRHLNRQGVRLVPPRAPRDIHVRYLATRRPSRRSPRCRRRCSPVTAASTKRSRLLTADAVMAAWMNSPGHRANILNGTFTQIGIGLAYAADGTPYWAMELGRPW